MVYTKGTQFSLMLLISHTWLMWSISFSIFGHASYRLHLSGELVENGRERCSYDAVSGWYWFGIGTAGGMKNEVVPPLECRVAGRNVQW